MKPRRERLIVDVVDLRQAAKVEETISTGYCDVIAENLGNWIAVEEDLIDSYGRFPKEIQAKEGFQALVAESGKNVSTLKELLRAVEGFRAQRVERISSLRAMEKGASK